MEDAFGTLVWVVAAVGVVVAIYTLIGTGRSYREIGGGGLAHEEDSRGSGSAMSAGAERDMEIRQMLEARNARRVRRGEAPQDVESEFAALTRRPTIVDDELREEIRQHVLARNARRVRAGGVPLDVEEEIERRIGETL
ncbi:MAG TPA: hypothetical protein VNA28_00690 [Solirubrobacteraceae bacterium]|nr:hypothetical protein [Solirubrobacteraceae bacterium]